MGCPDRFLIDSVLYYIKGIEKMEGGLSRPFSYCYLLIPIKEIEKMEGGLSNNQLYQCPQCPYAPQCP